MKSILPIVVDDRLPPGVVAFVDPHVTFDHIEPLEGRFGFAVHYVGPTLLAVLKLPTEGEEK